MDVKKFLKQNVQVQQKQIVAYAKEVQDKLDALKELQSKQEGSISTQRNLDTQLTENRLVREEFELLEDDAEVFKLVGPTLVKFDLADAKDNVEKRISFFDTKVQRTEADLKKYSANIAAYRKRINHIQAFFNELQVEQQRQVQQKQAQAAMKNQKRGNKKK
mmetsp:Transcript_1056/g.1645  ORF Transcript_1056/g.1645 Transcript_1056/m.1645 type:complete len:162 (+) Transcript_1056:191-676(+)